MPSSPPPTPRHAGPSPTNRRLGPRQMAFVRAWAEGVDVVIAWNRFLHVDGASDARRARGELQRLLDHLRSLARAHGRPELAALLRRDPEAMRDTGPQPPTLAAFAASQPPDFYSEAELIALYQQQHGPAQAGQANARNAARRRQRLRERLVAAVQWLEGVDVRLPQPADAVPAWLDERVAARLATVGIRTLGELHFWVRSKGFHWHRGIHRLGPQGAARIVRWLGEHAATLGALPAPALAPLRQVDTRALTPAPRIGVVPLERFVCPADRDGSRGANRAPVQGCRIAAANDPAAVQAWLGLRQPGSHTWRAYRKEAERFVLWAVLLRRQPLSSLDGADCEAYRTFLAAPGPEWTGPRGAQRWSDAWRPFEGPLSQRSQAVAITIVRSLCEWLVRQRYLAANPWHDAPTPPDAPPMAQLRALSQPQWALVQDWITTGLQRAPSPTLHRLRFLLDFGTMTGLRLAELAGARLGWFRRDQLDDGDFAWSMLVPGKHGTRREVPLPDRAMHALRAYLVQRGLPTDPLANAAQAPLIARLAEEAPLSAGRIYAILRAGFERCAEAVWRTDKRAAERIREASTHWLRHTYGAHAIAQGAPQDVVQAALGHASLASTAVYVRAGKARRHEALRAAFAGPPQPGPRQAGKPDVG